MSTNPNNCETCEYDRLNVDPDLHCYMFKDEPTDVCYKHSGRNTDMQFVLKVIERERNGGAF